MDNAEEMTRAGGKTHTRFPQPNARFGAMDSKRPGSAKLRQQMNAKRVIGKK